MERIMNLSVIKDLATIVGVLVAIGTVVKGYWEYRRNALLGRVEHFCNLKKEFIDDEPIAKITELLEANDPKVGDVPPLDRRRYLCFFEEVALLLRAGLITDDLAFYMFGYYATLCDSRTEFWKSIPKDEKYWVLYFDFLSRMKAVEASKNSDHSAFIERIRA